MPEPQVLALGGGQVFMEPDRPGIASYLLKMTGKTSPGIGWIGTARGDLERHRDMFYSTFERLDCEPSHLPLFERTPDVEQYVMSQDIIFVGGGNTKSMLAVWRDWNLDVILRDAWQSGIVLSGLSAGAICWFEQGVTDSWASELRAINCLGFIPGSCCPHYDGEAERKPATSRLIAAGHLSDGIAIDDGAGAHFIGPVLSACVTTLEDSRVYRLRKSGDRVLETPQEMKLLA